VKKRYRVALLILVNIFSAFLLTSCWNYREPDNLTLVRGLAIDPTEEGKFFLSVETADMHQAGPEGKVKSTVIETEGETMFDAVRNAVLVNVPRLYWSHATVVFISQKLAEEGVLKITDFLIRDAETRLDVHPIIYKGEEAKEIFDVKPISAELVSEEVMDLLHAQKSTSKTLHVQMFEFLERLANEGISPVMPVITTKENKGQKTLKLSGLALFKKDKLVGYLDEEDTKFYCFAIDEVDGGLLVVDVETEGKQGKITLEILNSGTRFKAKYKENKVTIEMKISVRASMNDVQIPGFPAEEKDFDIIMQMASQQLKYDIENVIKKVQVMNTDVFGFGSLVKRQLPKVWKEIGKDWDSIFKELEVEVSADVEIAHTGLLKKSIKRGD